MVCDQQRRLRFLWVVQATIGLIAGISLLQMIEDRTANVVGDTVRIGETTVATISFRLFGP